MMEALYYFFFPERVGEALVIRGGFLATALIYYAYHRFYLWADRRFGGEVETADPVLFSTPVIVQKVAKLTPEELDEKEKRRREMMAYVEPEDEAIGWPGSAKVILNRRADAL